MVVKGDLFGEPSGGHRGWLFRGRGWWSSGDLVSGSSGGARGWGFRGNSRMGLQGDLVGGFSGEPRE